MNLLEHYIKEVYNVEDITEEFKKKVGRNPVDPMVAVKMRVDCYGVEKDTEEIFRVPQWEEVKKQGYYMA